MGTCFFMHMEEIYRYENENEKEEKESRYAYISAKINSSSSNSSNTSNKAEKSSKLDLTTEYSICLGVHILFFEWIPEEPKVLILHMHDRGTSNCTSICKEISYCIMSNSKKVPRKKKPKEQHFICAQCGTRNTPLWRKHNFAIVCNACGLYSKTHGGIIRPPRLFRNRLSPSQ